MYIPSLGSSDCWVKTLKTVHHLTPTFRPHDALGSHVRALHDILVDSGCKSKIWSAKSGEMPPSQSIQKFKIREEGQDLLIYQAAIGSSLADVALGHSAPLVVNYHNMTPAHFVDKWAPEMAQQLRRGRKQLVQLAERADLALTVSEYNASELREAGFKNILVIPVLMGLKTITDSSKDSNHETQGARWLFVGRMVPNKAQHDLVTALDAYRKLYDPKATLTLVGSGLPKYEEAIFELAKQLNLLEAIKIKRGITEIEKELEYQKADVYVSLSDHEGFGVPLLEAMSHGVPVAAFERAAIGETVGSGGLLLADKAPIEIAAAVYEVVSNSESKELLIRSGHQRVHDFDPEAISEQYLQALRPLLER